MSKQKTHAENLPSAGEQIWEVIGNSDTLEIDEHQRIEYGILRFRDMVVDKLKIDIHPHQRMSSKKKNK